MMMIRRIRVLGYRCLQYVDAYLRPFQILVGPNASGKSTLLDVLAFVNDLIEARAPQVAVGKRCSDFRDLLWMRQGDHFEFTIDAHVPEERTRTLLRMFPGKDFATCQYELSIGMLPDREEVGILDETLRVGKSSQNGHRQLDIFPDPLMAPATIRKRSSPSGWQQLLRKHRDKDDTYQSEIKDWNPTFRLGPFKSTLANLPDDEERFAVATWFRNLLTQGVQRIALNSEAMRRPSPPGRPRAFQPDGSNLPWVIQDLTGKHNARYQQWVEHVQTVLPDITGIKTVERPEDRQRYLVVEYSSGLEVPSWSVSDGTLRFLALTILPYLVDLQGILLIEEPENGIHPRAVEAVFQSLSSVYDAQVLVATHSPVFVSLAEPDQLLCFSKTAGGATDVVSGDDHPELKRWRAKTSLGVLLAGGVLG